jgi:hypothetical protein
MLTLTLNGNRSEGAKGGSGFAKPRGVAPKVEAVALPLLKAAT